MRRLTPKYKMWLLLRAKNQLRRKAEASPEVALLRYEDGSRTVKISGRHIVPDILCLDDNYESTIELFSSIRKKASIPTRTTVTIPKRKKGSRPAWVRNYHDFSIINKISAGAALILASEYDRISRVFNLPPATINQHEWNPYVATTLFQLGFFDLLHLKPNVAPPSDALIVERMVAESNSDIKPGTEAIKSLFGKVGGNNQLRVALGSAVADAVENVVGHAYPTNWSERRWRAPLWWFVGAADPKTNRVTLVIFDQGITIPARLPLSWPLSTLTGLCLTLFGKPFCSNDPAFDGNAIEAAMELGKTSTGQTHRGKGLPKIREIIQKCPHGRLRIVSRHGECIYGADGTHLVTSHAVALMGTYIELEASLSV